MCTLSSGGVEIYRDLLTMNMRKIAVANVGVEGPQYWIEPIAIAITSASVVGRDLHFRIEVDRLPAQARLTTVV